MWKDTTSYSQGERGNKEPSCFTAKSGGVSITVTNGHIYYHGKWVAHCYKVGIDTQELKGCKDLEEAKTRALELVYAAITKIRAGVSAINAAT